MTFLFKNVLSYTTEGELVYTDGENLKIYFWCITVSRNLLSIFCVWLSVITPSWFSICKNSFGQLFPVFTVYAFFKCKRYCIYNAYLKYLTLPTYSYISSIHFSSCSHKSSGKIVFNTFIVQYNMSHTIRQRQHWAEFTIYTVSSYHLFYHSLREWHLFLKMVSWP